MDMLEKVDDDIADQPHEGTICSICLARAMPGTVTDCFFVHNIIVCHLIYFCYFFSIPKLCLGNACMFHVSVLRLSPMRGQHLVCVGANCAVGARDARLHRNGAQRCAAECRRRVEAAQCATRRKHSRAARRPHAVAAVCGARQARQRNVHYAALAGGALCARQRRCGLDADAGKSD